MIIDTGEVIAALVDIWEPLPDAELREFIEFMLVPDDDEIKYTADAVIARMKDGPWFAQDDDGTWRLAPKPDREEA